MDRDAINAARKPATIPISKESAIRMLVMMPT